MTRLSLIAILLAVALAGGCGRTHQDFTPSKPTPGSTRSADGDAITARGSISGRVVWKGDRPEAKPIRGLIHTKDGLRFDEVPNHFAPKIGEDGGLANAVVYLKTSRDASGGFPPLAVEQRDYQVQVRQGERMGGVGFVRVGDEIELRTHDPVYHSLRARGAAFFTLPFPAEAKPLRRKFDTGGHVEFTSAAGYFWSAADVFVCEHRFYAATDEDGTFRLEKVPEGEYELVTWVRNWELLGRDRDPETGKIVRLHFAEPIVRTHPLRVSKGETAELTVEIGQ